ncbi:MAG TPA: ABC transporter permease [Firmicutes bacterium]|jgi:D-methionine transport system permease protein|nr:methionine ABC transporter permease [Bacillota bacterium]HHT43622.1 ABC transporter permease [Bacillota bacterium]
MNSAALSMLWTAAVETLTMVGAATVLAVLGGLPLGILLAATAPGGILEKPWLNRILGTVVNLGRSIPFIILMVAIIPFTRSIVGTSIGTTAAIIPLTVAAIPFMARLVEGSLREVDPGVVEAAHSMGAAPGEIIWKVLLPEALPGLVLAITVTAVNLVGYSAMAGAIGGGGLGDLAIRYGYQRFRGDVMLQTIVILVLLVQGMQMLGDKIANRLYHRN